MYMVYIYIVTGVIHILFEYVHQPHAYSATLRIGLPNARINVNVFKFYVNDLLLNIHSK